MTWAEFKIRLFAYHRIERNDLYKVREICYQVYASNYYGKGKPVSKDRYWSLDKKSVTITDAMKQRIKEAQEQYQKDKNG